MQEHVTRGKDAKLSQPTYTMKIEKDVDIPMRDGTILKADVFRPDAPGQFPVLINMGIYQKDKLWVPPHDLEEKPNPYMNWETVNPEWWVPRGYICLRVDERGSGKTPGQLIAYSQQEAIDFYDAIEWAGHAPWSSGNVGTIGISFFARTQWWVANLKPPSLKCIMPWEGAADQYRDVLYHGGIFGAGFIVSWFTMHMAHHLIGRAYRHNPDTFQENLLWTMMRNNLDSGAFKSQQAWWESLELPLYAVGNWSGMALHLRGATEGFSRATSKHKKLRIHNGTHYHAFYSENGRHDQLRWFDHWLKGIDTGLMDEPPVKLAIRHGNDKSEWRHENEWPLARTQWTRLYLDLSKPDDNAGKDIDGVLARGNPTKTVSRSYEATGGSHGHPPAKGISLITPPMTEDTEITGPLAAQLWVSSTSEDMDLVPHHPQHRSGRQRRVGHRPAGRPGAGREGLAARVAPRTRSGTVEALPAVSQASAATLAQAGRNREGRRRNLADLDGIQERPPAAARHPAQGRHRERALYALPRRLQRRSEHDPFRRRQGVVPAGADHPGEVAGARSQHSVVMPAKAGIQ